MPEPKYGDYILCKIGLFQEVSIFYPNLKVFTRGIYFIYLKSFFFSAYQTRLLSCETIAENWNDKDNTSKIFWEVKWFTVRRSFWKKMWPTTQKFDASDSTQRCTLSKNLYKATALIRFKLWILPFYGRKNVIDMETQPRGYDERMNQWSRSFSDKS